MGHFPLECVCVVKKDEVGDEDVTEIDGRCRASLTGPRPTGWVTFDLGWEKRATQRFEGRAFETKEAAGTRAAQETKNRERRAAWQRPHELQGV